MSEPKTNGKRNRAAGHRLEKVVAQMLRDAGFPHVVTSRAESKSRDDRGVDLMNKDELTNGRLPYNVQCKNTTERPKYDQILSEMPDESGVTNVIIHKYTSKREQLFVTRGTFAIINVVDFMSMIAELERLRKTNKYLIDSQVLNKI